MAERRDVGTLRRESREDNPGFDEVVPFIGTNGVALWINRGFVAVAASASTAPTLPPTPAGTITVVARMRVSEHSADYAPADLPTGQIDAIDIAGMSKRLSYKTYGGYGELVSEVPATTPAPTPLPPPGTPSGPYFSYALQWILFCFVAIFGWYTFIRKEAERLADEHARLTSGAGPDPEDDTGLVSEPTNARGNS